MSTATYRIPRVRLIDTPSPPPNSKSAFEIMESATQRSKYGKCRRRRVLVSLLPLRIAGLRGRNLELVEHRVFGD